MMRKEDVFTIILKIKDYTIKEDRNGGLIIHFWLKEGKYGHFDFIWGRRVDLSEIEHCSFEKTRRFWTEWLHSSVGDKLSSFREYRDMITRSLLVLKLLSFQPTGAIAAAATTSLPESIGNERNRDYRFTWLRDASFTLRAMFNTGHINEAGAFVRWLSRTYETHGIRNLQIMYSLEGERELPEKVLDHLKGYRDSRPVRIGNNAYNQRQWDI